MAKIYSFISKKGNKVVFRNPNMDDFEPIWQFACNLAKEDTFVALNKVPTEIEERKWFDEMIEKVENNTAIYIFVDVNVTFAGNGRVLIGSQRGAHVGHLGISLAPQFRSEGIGTELMKSLISEAKSHKLRLLELTCFENNTAALHMYEKVGFKKAGVVPGAIKWKDEFVGSVHMYLPL